MNNFEDKLRKSNLEGVKVTLGRQETPVLCIPSYVVIITPEDMDIEDILDMHLVIETFKHRKIKALEFHDEFNHRMGKENNQRIRMPLTISDSPVFRYYYPASHYKKIYLSKVIREVIQSIENDRI